MGVGGGGRTKKKNTLFFALLLERVPPIPPNARAPSPRPLAARAAPARRAEGPTPSFAGRAFHVPFRCAFFFPPPVLAPRAEGIERDRAPSRDSASDARREQAPAGAHPPRFRVRNGAARFGRLDRAPAQVRAPGGGRAEDAVRAGALCSGEGREERGEALGARPIRRRPPCRQHSPPPGLPFPSPLRPPPPQVKEILVEESNVQPVNSPVTVREGEREREEGGGWRPFLMV